MTDTKDGVQALSAVGRIFSTLEKILVPFFMMLVELARLKQKKAEDKVAYYESKDKATAAKDEVDKKYAGKSSREILTDFLNSDSGPK